ncbi:MAG TPA: response regulator [Chroococcales cyanobacterium]
MAESRAKRKILAIEDEPEIRRFLRVTLTEHGYDVYLAADGESGLALCAEENPDIVILDLGLPDIDGNDVVQRIREWSTVPVIILSVRGQESDKVNALDNGADDYLTKPFGVEELLARIRVSIRKSSRSQENRNDPLFCSGNLKVDMRLRTVTVNDEEVHLTPIEYKLLHELIKHAGAIVTQQTLLRNVWGPGYAKEGHYVRVYMANLRRKLEEDPAQPKYLITEPGVGYRLRTTQALSSL